MKSDVQLKLQMDRDIWVDALIAERDRYRKALEEIRNFTEDPASAIVAGKALGDA